jgi:hypothetical protein
MIYTDQIFPSLTPSLNTNGKILSIYTEGIAVRIERIKKKPNNAMTCKVL